MRLTHSSQLLRSAGMLAVAWGVFGLVARAEHRLLAQEETTQEESAPEDPSPENSAPAAPENLAAPEDAQDAEAEQSASGPLTLGEVLPDDVPVAVSSSAVQQILPESWADWGTEVAELFERLYEDDPTVEEADQILERLRVKKNTLDRAIGDSKYSMATGRLEELRGRIVKRLEVIDAVQSLTQSGYQVDPKAQVERLFANAAAKADAAKSDLNRYSTGSQWVSYLRLDRLSEVLRNRDQSEDALNLFETVSDRIAGGQQYSGEQSQFLQRRSLNDLTAALDALTDGLDQPSDKREATAQNIAELVQALENYEAFGSLRGSETLKRSLSTLSASGSGGAKLANLIRRLYLQDNVRATVSEGLIVSLMNDSRVERDLINDCIFGARVVGSQLASATLQVDLVPSATTAAFRLNLSGNVTTDTRGIAEQATVFSRGNHNFFAHKDVTFDGYDFASGPAVVSVSANNRVYGAQARTRIPIVKGIIRNIALDRARELTPRSNALTRDKITEKVGGDFNSEVNQILGDAEGRLNNEFYNRLRSAGMYPERQSVSTTDQSLSISARVLSGDELAASEPPALPVPQSGVGVQVHESYMNNALNRMDIAGRTMSNEELRTEFREFAETLLGRPVNMDNRSNVIDSEVTEEAEETDESVTNAKFIFDDTDPIRVQVESDQLTLILRAGLDLEGDKEDIPQQIITIPMDVRLVGSFVQLVPGTIGVEPAERVRNRFRQIAQANVMRNKIRSTLPPRQFDASFNFQLEEKRLDLVLQTLDLANGWITGTLQ